MDELLCRLNDCMNDLDDIYDDLVEEEVDTTDLLKAIDMIDKYYKKLSYDFEHSGEEEEPDFYHERLQEKLDRENYGG